MGTQVHQEIHPKPLIRKGLGSFLGLCWDELRTRAGNRSCPMSQDNFGGSRPQDAKRAKPTLAEHSLAGCPAKASLETRPPLRCCPVRCSLCIPRLRLLTGPSAPLCSGRPCTARRQDALASPSAVPSPQRSPTPRLPRSPFFPPTCAAPANNTPGTPEETPVGHPRCSPHLTHGFLCSYSQSRDFRRLFSSATSHRSAKSAWSAQHGLA